MEEERLRAIEEAEAALRNHPGFERRLGLEALWTSIDHVMLPNLGELVALLRQPAHDEDLFAELIQNVRPPEVRERYQAEITRRLANYVASALALVDHVRALTSGSEALYIEEFRRRRAAIAREPEIGFVQELRNFTLHYQLPVFAHRAAIHTREEEQTTEFAVTLLTASLRRWDGWTSKSEQLLAQNPEYIDLLPLVERHGQLMMELNTWIHDRMQEDFDPIRRELNDLVRRYNAMLFGVPEEEVDAFIRQRLESMGGGPWLTRDT